MGAFEKGKKLAWLKQEPKVNTCHILSNVHCLSEGVDIPALDAVLFLAPRNSQVEVMQSVGRVMRQAKDRQKNRGYVILPVVIPAGTSPEVALNNNQTYKVVWQVLQALRSHDDRFDAMINKMELIGPDLQKMEVIAVTESYQTHATPKEEEQNQPTIGVADSPAPYGIQGELDFHMGDIERAIYAKLVKKCGNRRHWEEWAKDIASIANTHIDRIQGILANPDYLQEQQAFARFAKELRENLNDSITDAEVVEMLAQHLITKPVFDALFQQYTFTQHNPISKAMEQILTPIQAHGLARETYSRSVLSQCSLAGRRNPHPRGQAKNHY
ncbi:hypothetical protein [Candidatus Nitrosacidococcus sp. I8]|uniref:hypothetical protein n=1 Tax=Candidatus Nitrosacidococcus sp. I8 TaxID=2942908 RepID=UPI0039B6F098